MSEPQFSIHDLFGEENRSDLQKWVDQDELVGLVDESCGGIIGYINRHHAERIVEALNKPCPTRAALADCVELLKSVQEKTEGPMAMPWPEIERGERALK
jgi:hypothetical protein